MEPKKDDDKKYFDVAPPKQASAPLISTQKRRILSRSVPVESSNTDVNVAVNSKKEASPDTLMDPDEAGETEPTSPEIIDKPSEATIEPIPDSEKDEGSDQQDESRVEIAEEDLPSVDPLPGTIDVSVEEPADVPPENETKQEPDDDKTGNDANAVDVDAIDNHVAPEEPVHQKDEESPESEPTEVDSPTSRDSAETPPLQEAEADKPEELTPVAEKYAVTDSLPDTDNKKTEDPVDNMQEPKIYDTKEYYVPIGKAHHKHGGAKGAFAFGIICAVIVLAAVVAYMYYVAK